jgi:hypothetical protein
MGFRSAAAGRWFRRDRGEWDGTISRSRLDRRARPLGRGPGATREQLAAMPSVADRYFQQLPRSYLYFGFTAVVDLNVVDQKRVASIRAAPLAPTVFDCGNGLALANGYPMSFLPPEQRFALYPNFVYDPRQAAAIPKAYAPSEHAPAASVARRALPRSTPSKSSSSKAASSGAPSSPRVKTMQGATPSRKVDESSVPRLGT